MTKPSLLVFFVLIAFLPAARADDAATAASAFQQAKQLADQGKWAEACNLYEASYRAEPQLGVLLHLADCHEHVGRFASAWIAFNDAVELARRRADSRQVVAQARADALKPKLAYLHLVVSSPAAPGLVVRRDGADVTALVGTTLVIDPGEHDITAGAPGYAEWRHHVTIQPNAATIELTVPALAKESAPPADVTPKPAHEGAIKVTTQPEAHIALDAIEVGVGHYEGKLSAGGHQLRVTAPGMHPYQSEIFVSEGEQRALVVTLDATSATVGQTSAAVSSLSPRGRLGVGFELRASYASSTSKATGGSMFLGAVFADVKLSQRWGIRVAARVDRVGIGYSRPDNPDVPNHVSALFAGPGAFFVATLNRSPMSDLHAVFGPGLRWPISTEESFDTAITRRPDIPVQPDLELGFGGTLHGAFMELVGRFVFNRFARFSDGSLNSDSGPSYFLGLAVGWSSRS